jgi:hypothetical protein
MGMLTFIFDREHRIRPTTAILALAYVPGKEPQRCAIVNYTPEGACVSSAGKLPDAFCLRVIDSAIERMCLVVWREEDLVGVRYVNARTMPTVTENDGALRLSSGAI